MFDWTGIMFEFSELLLLLPDIWFNVLKLCLKEIIGWCIVQGDGRGGPLQQPSRQYGSGGSGRRHRPLADDGCIRCQQRGQRHRCHRPTNQRFVVGGTKIAEIPGYSNSRATMYDAFEPWRLEEPFLKAIPHSINIAALTWYFRNYLFGHWRVVIIPSYA